MHYRVFVVFPLLSGMTQALVRRYPADSVYPSMASSVVSGAMAYSAASGAMVSSAVSGVMASSVASEVISTPVVSGAMSTYLSGAMYTCTPVVSGAIPTSDFVYTSMAYNSLPSNTP